MSETQKSFWDMLKPGQTTSLPQFTKELFEPVTTGLANVARPSTNTSTTTNNTPTVHQYNPYGVDTFGGQVTNTLLNFGDKVDNFLGGANRGGSVPGAVQIDQAKLNTFVPLASGTTGNVVNASNTTDTLYSTPTNWAEQASRAYQDPLVNFDQNYYTELLKTDPKAAQAYLARYATKNEISVDEKTGEVIVNRIPGTMEGSGTFGPVGGTVVETPPKEGDFKAGANGQPLIFKNGRWEVYGARNTREVITEDPNAEPVPGADANVPIDKYMESLGTETLAGKAYAEALARRMASIDEQQRTAGLSYGDMYEQARMSQAARRGMSDVSGMTGGMADQAQSRMSAAEIASLSQIGMGREATMRQLEMAELNAPMEAFQEGAQIDAYERSKAMMDRDMQQAQTLFEQAQSGWVQNEDGTWTNIDKQTQDLISLQAINATQRSELLGEIQYWQSYLTSNPGNQQALTTLTDLQAQYATLLSQSKDLAAQRTTGSSGSQPGPGPEPGPEPDGFVQQTGLTVRKSGEMFIESTLANLGFTDDMALPNFEVRIQSISDLAPLVYQLAGNKATEGYNFADEIDLITRAVYSPGELLPDEFEQLKALNIYKERTSYAQALGLGNGVNDEGQITHLYPINPRNQEFIASLLESGRLTEAQLQKSIQGNNYNLSTLYFADYQEFLEEQRG
jgi:hypothetical protein